MPSPTPDEAPVSVSPSERLVSPQLLVATAGVVLFLVVGLLVVGIFFREPLMKVSEVFVEQFGGFGVGFGYFITDALTLPVPNDIGPILGIAGGMSFLEVSVWGAAGSVGGGVVGYQIGRRLRTTRLVAFVLERNDGRAQRMLDRHGLKAVAVAAITPLPYSIFCWAAGAGKLPFWRFVALSIPLRIVRVTGYLYLIQLGLMPT